MGLRGMVESRVKDFTSVTEQPDALASAEQLERLAHRYHFARSYAVGARVLEVACGTGIGLGYLAGTAKRVVGGDYTESLLRSARHEYGGAIPLVRLDAHHLPFADESFDLAVMLEAVYYLSDPACFVEEARRVLAPGGIIVLSTVNPEWSGHVGSDLTVSFVSARRLADLLASGGFEKIELSAAFPVRTASPRAAAIALLRRVAASVGVIPKTLGGRTRLKRLFYGRLTPLPGRLELVAAVRPAVAIERDQPCTDYKILYAAAVRP